VFCMEKAISLAQVFRDSPAFKSLFPWWLARQPRRLAAVVWRSEQREGYGRVQPTQLAAVLRVWRKSSPSTSAYSATDGPSCRHGMPLPILSIADSPPSHSAAGGREALAATDEPSKEPPSAGVTFRCRAICCTVAFHWSSRGRNAIGKVIPTRREGWIPKARHWMTKFSRASRNTGWAAAARDASRSARLPASDRGGLAASRLRRTKPTTASNPIASLPPPPPVPDDSPGTLLVRICHSLDCSFQKRVGESNLGPLARPRRAAYHRLASLHSGADGCLPINQSAQTARMPGG